ncbi:MAG: hypothetical protein JJU26_05345 [Oceanicaulis sp.]|uniref:hypothetical protein n=1 Tax=Glycocaulis sp. TaxID=1969725 RepID=UPI0025C4E93C|nr:hypothetical protein [Glycocaulis sp.]MCC5981127.1 hypothetical protein [Oceanicaulis sp.]MCH8520367.1 hypothetical protein [Glycocaulis sp.]
MIILPALAALTLYSEPAQPPSRLDPDDIEALSALLEALSAGEDTPPGEAAPETDTADAPAAADTPEEETEIEPEAEAEAALEAEPETEADAESEPEPQPEAELAADIVIDDTPAQIEAMGPHVGPAQYEAVRGAPFGDGVTLHWRVTIRPLGEDGAQMPDSEDDIGNGVQRERRFIAGNGWAGELKDDGLVLTDFAARRQLRASFGNGTLVNTSLYALARRNTDIYVFLSEGGQREQIEFGPDTVFDRFWLEAAMRVAAVPAMLRTENRTDENGQTQINWRQGDDDRIIASARYGGCDLPETPHTPYLLAGLGYTLSLHPQIVTALGEQGEIPCAFSFMVISPDSPQGRVEHWSLQSASNDGVNMESLLPLDLVLPDGELLDQAVMEVALDTALGQRGSAPAAPEFLGDIQALRRSGDYAGAFLMLAQETAHFGPCPAETIGSERLACAGAGTLVQQGVGNADLERVLEATTAVEEGAHRVAIENIRPFASRDDQPGAAARTILANEILSLSPEERTRLNGNIDPVALLEEALILDPFAPDAYWHIGRRYMEAGAPEAAWVLFDLGRALPGRTATPLLQQADRMEQNLRQLAPALFGPPSQP